jgi:hypothetical protein
VSLGRWRASKVRVEEEKNLPNNYFYDMEAHFGGCGTFEWSKVWATSYKLSLGIAFEVVPTVEGSTCSGSVR